MSERCYLHNANEAPQATYEMLLPIGNPVPLCAPCCAWWRQDAAARPDDLACQPVWIRDCPRSREEVAA